MPGPNEDKSCRELALIRVFVNSRRLAWPRAKGEPASVVDNSQAIKTIVKTKTKTFPRFYLSLNRLSPLKFAGKPKISCSWNNSW